jgi:hypothetical protein
LNIFYYQSLISLPQGIGLPMASSLGHQYMLEKGRNKQTNKNQNKTLKTNTPTNILTNTNQLERPFCCFVLFFL